MDHYDRANEIIDAIEGRAPQNFSDGDMVALGQLHALVALLDALKGLLGSPVPTVPAVPFDQTKEGWTWPTSE